MNKVNNTGFSLVEIIVVIDIMAIITAAGAPQLMKTIERRRKSTDIQICKTIETCVNTALTAISEKN